MDMTSNERLVKILTAPPAIQEQIDLLLSGKVSKPADPPAGPLLLGMTAAAKLLGCSRVSIWRLTKFGKLPRVELLPGRYRVRRADLEALAAGKAVTP